MAFNTAKGWRNSEKGFQPIDRFKCRYYGGFFLITVTTDNRKSHFAVVFSPNILLR